MLFRSRAARNVSGHGISSCACSAGFTGSNGGSCAACVPGLVKAGVGSEACVACAENEYANPSNTICVACTGNSTSLAASDNRSACACDAGFALNPIAPFDCQECAAGQRAVVLERIIASSQYVAADAVFESWAAQKSGVPGWRFVRFLPPGATTHHQATDYLQGTDVYGRGAVTPATAATQGSWSVNFGRFDQLLLANGDRSEWVYFNRNVLRTSHCSPCSFAWIKSSRPTSINPGNYHITSGDVVHIAAGTWEDGIVYLDRSSILKIINGAHNHMSPNGGYVFVRDSAPLPPVETAEGGPVCEVCPAGEYNNLRRQTACMPCPADEYQPATGQLACLARPLSSVSLVGAVQRSECACLPGFAREIDECRQCLPGSYKNSTENTACLPCAAGQTSANASTSAAQCQDCAPQFLATTTGGLQCQACPSNAVAPLGGVGLGACQCAPGFTGPAGNCMPCASGTFKPLAGGHNCTRCAPGLAGVNSSVTVLTSAASCVACAADSYEDAFVCRACPTYSVSLQGSDSVHLCTCVPTTITRWSVSDSDGW